MSLVHITSIKETIYMKGTCSDKSYYQSLAEVFLSKNFQMEGCPIRYECLAQTLSFDVPVCPEKYGSNETLDACYEKAMMITKKISILHPKNVAIIKNSILIKDLTILTIQRDLHWMLGSKICDHPVNKMSGPVKWSRL